MNHYAQGTRVRVRGSFSVDGSPEAPTTVVAKVRKPDGTVTTLSTTAGTEGVYDAFVTVDQAGTWWYSFVGTGTAEAAGERAFTVLERIAA